MMSYPSEIFEANVIRKQGLRSGDTCLTITICLVLCIAILDITIKCKTATFFSVGGSQTWDSQARYTGPHLHGCAYAANNTPGGHPEPEEYLQARMTNSLPPGYTWTARISCNEWCSRVLQGATSTARKTLQFIVGRELLGTAGRPSETRISCETPQPPSTTI